MNLLDELTWRGLVHQVTDPVLAREALAQPIRAYIGFDPSAPSLHVGSLLPLTTLRRLQLHGHTPIALVGGGTGMIGDPSGKSEERKLLSAADVTRNTDALRQQIGRFVDFDGPNGALLVDNLQWLGEVRLIDFLRDVGKHFSVNAMVQRDSVRTRLEQRDQGISFTEFSYMLLQAYDFFVLHRDHGCRAQLGGSDQWGNIVSGTDLIGRMGEPGAGAPFGLTMPLVTTKAGQKFGKTESGAVWLDPARTSPYRFYQFWINVEDADVGKYLRFFTFLDQPAIVELEARHAEAPHLRQAQKVLAAEVTQLVHGAEQLAQVQAATALLFGGDPRTAAAASFEILRAELPFATAAVVDGGVPLQGLLVGDDDQHPFRSNGEAKRALQANSVAVNGAKVGPDLQGRLERSQLLHGRFALVRVGKKQYFLAECA